MTNEITLLVADDTEANLLAANQAISSLPNEDLVVVSLGSREAYIVPVGSKFTFEELTGELTPSIGKKGLTLLSETINRLLQRSEFPIRTAFDVSNENLYRNIWCQYSEDPRHFYVPDDKKFIPVTISSPVRINHSSSYLTMSPSEALKQMSSFDGVISDLMFLGKDEKIHGRYLEYVNEVEDFENAQILREGKLTKERLERILQEENDSIRRGGFGSEEKVSEIENILSRWEQIEPQFAYGAVLMLDAQKYGKPSVLITEMHHHKYARGINAVQSLDGAKVLSPIIQRGIITTDEEFSDLGRRYIASKCLRSPKNTSAPWKTAIAKVVSQIKWIK